MKRTRRRKMLLIIGVLLTVFGVVLIWFNIPYSPIKTEFQKEVSSLMTANKLPASDYVFTEKDFSHLPDIIQKYIKNCNYIGKPKMNYLKMEYHNVDFMQNKNGPKLLINYTQYNFASGLSRMALIESSILGIPFDGYDYYKNGIGGMKGVVAKALTVFNQKGKDMDKACLVTFLAESFFIPSVLLQNNIIFEKLSDYEIKATITHGDQTASGIFTFNEKYEMISFTTNDRAAIKPDGTMEYIPWTAICTEYKLYENGIRCPTKFQAVWNYPTEDFIYFNGNIYQISYGF
jgi:hypothetical protein